MSDAAELFFTQCIKHARTLPLSESVVFLRGMMESCTDTETVQRIHKIYTFLSESDRQLELIQTGQLKLPLEGRKERE